MPSQNTKTVKINITDITLSVLGAHSSNKWTEKLVVPALPPSNLNNCKIIDVNYDLKVFLQLVILCIYPYIVYSNSLYFTNRNFSWS